MIVQSIGSVARFLMSFSIKSTPKTENNQPEPTMQEPEFSNEELELMIDAIWRRQRCLLQGIDDLRNMVLYWRS